MEGRMGNSYSVDYRDVHVSCPVPDIVQEADK